MSNLYDEDFALWSETQGALLRRRAARRLDAFPRQGDGPVSDEPDSLVLTLLRAIRGDIGEVKSDLVEIKERLGFLESGYASLSRRVDRMGGDVEQIKRRLDIVDAPI